MKKKNFILIIVLSFLIYTTILDLISIKGIVPNLPLILTVILSNIYGEKLGIKYGVILGLLQDIIFSSVIGINTLVLLIAGTISEKSRGKYFNSNFVLSLFVLIICTGMSYIVKFLMGYLVGNNISIKDLLDIKILVEIGYNTIIAAPIYLIIKSKYKDPMVKFEKEY